MGIPDPHRAVDRYPHEFSGGMRQRVVTAMALACNPSLLIADEPTTALDVSIQAQILELLLELKEQEKMSILLITHDLGVVAGMADRILVMYAGIVVEMGTTDEIFYEGMHPYTKALISAIPIADPGVERRRTRIILSGQVPSPSDKPSSCIFARRCPYATDRCRREEPPLREAAPGHLVACHEI